MFNQGFGGGFGGAGFNQGMPSGFGNNGFGNQYGGFGAQGNFPQANMQAGFGQQGFNQMAQFNQMGAGAATPFGFNQMQGVPQFGGQPNQAAIPGAVPTPTPNVAGAPQGMITPQQMVAQQQQMAAQQQQQQVVVQQQRELAASPSPPPPVPAVAESATMPATTVPAAGGSPSVSATAATIPAAPSQASPVAARDPNTPKSWLQGHKGPVHGVAALENGFIASCGGDGDDKSLLLVDLETGNYKRNKATSMLRCVAPHSRESVVAGGDNNTLGIWETTSGKRQQAFEGHEGSVTAVVTLPNSDVVSSSTDETVRIWDTLAGQCKHIVQFPAPVISLAAVGATEIVCVSEQQPLVMIDNLGNQQRVFERLDTMDILCVAALENGDVITGSADGTIRLWNSDDGREVAAFPTGPSAVTCVVALPNNEIMSGSQDGVVRVWAQSETGYYVEKQQYAFTAKTSPINCLALDVKNHVITGNSEGIVSVWEQH